MELRKLNGNDIFKMSKIIKKINVNIDFNEMTKLIESNMKENETAESNATEKAQIMAGISIVKNILENLYLAQDEVNDFLGGLVGISGAEFGNKDIDEVAEVIVKFKDMVKGTRFFTHVSRLM